MERKIIQNQIAMFNLLGAIAEKLTGQVSTVTIEQEDGGLIKIVPNTSSVTFALGGVEQHSSCLNQTTMHKD